MQYPRIVETNTQAQSVAYKEDEEFFFACWFVGPQKHKVCAVAIFHSLNASRRVQFKCALEAALRHLSCVHLALIRSLSCFENECMSFYVPA
jgi:hypothetical protein